MKTWILALALALGLNMSAQEKANRPEPLKPEQRVELQVKKMTLALDLNEKQQKEVKDLLLTKGREREAAKTQLKTKREAGAKLTADERFAMQNKRLDEQIAMKREFKNILTAEQYAKLEDMRKERRKNFTNGRKNFKKHAKR